MAQRKDLYRLFTTKGIRVNRRKDSNNWTLEEQIDWYITQYTQYLEDRNQPDKFIKFNNKTSIDSFKFKKEVNDLLIDILNLLIDPNNYYYEVDKNNILERITDMGTKVAVLYNEGVVGKDRNFDDILERFALGSGAYLSDWEREKDSNNALVIRGLGGNSRKAIKHCWETNRDFYAVDTGYLGNDQYKTKVWHRVTYNNLQHLGPIIQRPTDRLALLNYKFKKFKTGSKILICPPSQKVMLLWDQPSPEDWTAQTIKELRKYTDRPIEVRLKPNRTERTTNKSIWAALEDDVYCLVTYNSIAATEAILYGKPAIALGPNAAQVICNTALDQIDNLNIPSRDEVEAFAAHLSYCQFSITELQDGTAWKILNESR